ncbi:MAG: hypothetical protein O7H41_04800 [Planctomycetota bacterium]|nr:hypothetical protein [Planctomycetota bacterium]
MESEGPGNLDTYFQRLEEDRAFAEELKKYMETPEEGEAEGEEEAAVEEEAAGEVAEVPGPAEAPSEGPPPSTGPFPVIDKTPPRKPAGPVTLMDLHGAGERAQILRERRKRALTKLRATRKRLLESWQALGETQARLEEGERKLGEFRAREDQNLARIEDLQDGLQKLSQAYDQHLKIMSGLKDVYDNLLGDEKKKRG